MSIESGQKDFNLEEKLADVRLSPSERQEALAALHTAEGVVAGIESVARFFRRVVEVVTPKPALKH